MWPRKLITKHIFISSEKFLAQENELDEYQLNPVLSRSLKAALMSPYFAPKEPTFLYYIFFLPIIFSPVPEMVTVDQVGD